jgi:hypothetical protein
MTDIEFNPITFAFQVVEKAHPDLKFEFHFELHADPNT